MIDRIDQLFAVARGESTNIPPPPPITERLVRPSGPLDARIAVIGEAGGKQEAEDGEPFVGRSGQLLRKIMQAAGVRPDECYLDNVYPYYPPSGKIKNIDAERLKIETDHLLRRLDRLTDVKVLVPTGNIALQAILELAGITKHRGSIYIYDVMYDHTKARMQRPVKCIPTIHPAAVLRGQEQWARRCYLDWQRIASQAKTEGVPQVKRQLLTNPTEDECTQFYRRAQIAPRMAVDIETKPSEDRITCIAFSINNVEALVLTWDHLDHMPFIKSLLKLPCDKEWWNKLYDLWWLTHKGIEVNGLQIDAMTMLHALMPTDNVSLAYATSLYTFEPYYKDDIKDDDDKTVDENWEQYKRYNATDARVTRELTGVIEPWLEKAGLVQFHREHYEELAEPMLDLMIRGVRIDHERCKVVRAELLHEALRTRDELAWFNDGEPLFTLTTKRDQLIHKTLMLGRDPFIFIGDVEGEFTDWAGIPRTRVYKAIEIQTSIDRIAAKTVSKTKLRQLLYGKYEVPAHYKRRDSGEETETLDIFALRKIRYDYRGDPTISRITDLAIDHAKAQKLATFISDDKYDEDGRMRFALKTTTEAGRLASSASPRGKKNNSQNQPRDPRVRGLILPEPDHIVMQLDGAQAEARVCFVRTKDPELIRLAGLRSSEYDQHRHTGVICGFAPDRYEIPENFAAITKSQRQVCKNISHGAQRSMQGMTLAQTILREGLVDDQGEPIVYDSEYCDEIIAMYHRRFPAIRQWHHSVRRQLRKERCLWNAWGRPWPVPYFEWSEELYRRAYSFQLQSDIAAWLNLRGFKAIYYWLKENNMRSRIMLQEHDGLVLSCHPKEAYDVAVFGRDSLEAPWDCDGEQIWVPVETQVGPRWGQGVEFGELPGRVEFENVVDEVLK